jgi:hypothetical protein
VGDDLPRPSQHILYEHDRASIVRRQIFTRKSDRHLDRRAFMAITEFPKLVAKFHFIRTPEMFKLLRLR